jgi:hypothetical protein
MVAVKVEGRPLFQTVRPIRPNDEIVVYFNDTNTKSKDPDAVPQPEVVSQNIEEVPEVAHSPLSAGPETVSQTDCQEMDVHDDVIDVTTVSSDVEKAPEIQTGKH